MALHGEQVRLGGERRTLRMEFNQLAELNRTCRQELGESWQDAVQAEGDTEVALDPYLLRLLLYHALKAQHPGVSEDQVGQWIQEEVNERGIEQAMQDLFRGFLGALKAGGYLPDEFDMEAMENGGPPEEGKAEAETET